jgi:hypothetical protein
VSASSRPATTCSARPAIWHVKTTHRILSGKHYKILMGSQRILNCCSPTSLPYCALYNYEHGSVGYGCAEYSGYTSTVLLNPVTTGLGTLTGMNSSTPTSQTAYTTSATNSTTATASPSDWHGLSTGAKAGIAVGSVAVVAVICFLFYLTWSHKRKSREAARQSYTGSTTTYAASSTVHPSGEYSGTKFVFPSPKSPPWEYSSTAGDRYSTGPIEMVRKTIQCIPYTSTCQVLRGNGR